MPKDTSLPIAFNRAEKIELSVVERKEITQEYADFYMQHHVESEEETALSLSVKLNRSIAENFQNALGVFIQQEAHRLAFAETTDALEIRAFLKQNALPPKLASYLPLEYRIYSLLLNTVKQFISREQAHTDSHVLGNGYKKLAKQYFGTCLITRTPLADDVQWHHVLRDGRPPIPLTKAGHEKVDESERKRVFSTDPIYKVLQAIKLQEANEGRSYSWPQLRRACEKGSNIAWRRKAKAALQDAHLPYQDEVIIEWIKKNGSLLSRSH